MLKRLSLHNYRGFRRFTVEFNRNYTLLVGRNNAGKSTILEALRLVGDVLRSPSKNRFKTEASSRFTDETIVFALDAAKRGFSLTELRHNDTEEESAIIAEFRYGPRLVIIFPVDEIPYYVVEYGYGRDEDISVIKTRIVGLPPIGLLAPPEKGLSKDHVRASATTGLASRHFRNYWRWFPENFDEFNRLMLRTWGASLRLPSLEFHPELNNYVYQMMCEEEEGRLREVSRLGAGFQVWMQLVSHLVRYPEGTTIVLDEPDAHLHSDLQRKLIALLKGLGNRQVIIATHSIELINEAPQESVVYIDRQLDTSRRLADDWNVSNILNELGVSASFIQAKVARSRVCLFVEGQDSAILKRIAIILNADALGSDGAVAWIPLHGHANWEKLFSIPYATLRNVAGQDITSCVVLDRDFRTDDQVSELLNKLAPRVAFAFVWGRKELENYLLEPAVVYRVVQDELENRYERTGEKIEGPSLDDIVSKIDAITRDQRHFVHSRLLEEVQKSAPPNFRGARVTEEFNRRFEVEWEDPAKRIEICHGKDALESLLKWLRGYKVSITPGRIAESFHEAELPADIVTVLNGFTSALEEMKHR